MKVHGIVLAVLLSVVAFSASAAELSAESDIVSVVVFPDRALVTRSAKLSLDEGPQSVHFLNLPTNIDQDSLQVKGEGVAGVHLLSTEVKKNVLERPRAEEIARLEAEIQDARDQIAATEARSEDLKTEDDLVHAIGVYTGEQFSKEFITCEPQPEEWGAMVEFQHDNLARISQDILRTNIAKRELNRQLDALLRRLNEIQGQAARENLDVTVFLSASKPGNFELLLSYVIYGTNWHPSYDARADVQNQQVQFTGIGNVRQNTGEDWRDVTLSLSTARPAVGAEMPELQPWFITPRPILSDAGGIITGAEMAAPLRLEKDYRAAPAEVEAATIIPLETSVQFAVPYKMDVPSDNAYHKATVFTDKLKADFFYNATPKLSAYAYLVGKVVNTTGAFWLPGRTTVFVDENMIGYIPIDTVAANEEISLDFGIDEGITVEREELERKEDESHLFGKRKEKRFKDKIIVTNHKPRPVKLRLIDQIPVSRHEEIRITDVKFSMAPVERNSDTGIVQWDLQLAPNEMKEITIQFVVVYPLDMEVFGL